MDFLNLNMTFFEENDFKDTWLTDYGAFVQALIGTISYSAPNGRDLLSRYDTQKTYEWRQKGKKVFFLTFIVYNCKL